MNKADAAIEIILEARRERQPSNTAIKRLVKALALLGVTGADLIPVLSYLDICRPDGTTYVEYVKRIW
jgi:hypothetical protein